MITSEAGLLLIKKFEGLRLEAYKCPAGVWTIGYGSTSNVFPGLKITEAEADARLKQDVQTSEKCVNQSVHVPITQYQFDALVSFTLNLGCGRLRNSTLLGLLNAGEDTEAAEQFLRWNKAGGVELAGLTKRREAEKDMFLGIVGGYA